MNNLERSKVEELGWVLERIDNSNFITICPIMFVYKKIINEESFYRMRIRDTTVEVVILAKKPSRFFEHLPEVYKRLETTTHFENRMFLGKIENMEELKLLMKFLEINKK